VYVPTAVSDQPVMPALAMRLSVPPEGLRSGDIVLRFPSVDDVDAILPAFTDPELREAGNLPAFDRAGLVASIEELPSLAEMGRLLALAAVAAETGEVVGGATLHHLDAERRIVEIGYFTLPHARRRGIATTIARLLAEHAFAPATRARAWSARCRNRMGAASTRRSTPSSRANDRATSMTLPRQAGLDRNSDLEV
jgi:RimJ/RimL family protein N-acetyltransferase